MLAVDPGTGRTHQVRIHASKAEMPLLGDAEYGGPRQMTLANGRVLLLSRIAQATGGYLNVPDRAFVPPSTWVQQQVSLRMWLLPLAIVALLLDVALRGRTLL